MCMAILVIGGAGYIGSHTVVELLNENKEVIVVDNFSNSKPEMLGKIKKITNKDFKFYELDYSNKEKMDKVFAENKIDSVIHFAGYKAVGESVEKPIEYYTNNVFLLFWSMQQANYGFFCIKFNFKRNPYRHFCKLREQVIYEGADNVAAIVMETITGSNGVIIPPKGYLKGVRAICDEFDIMMICDEVMAGFGRTGKILHSRTLTLSLIS